MIKIKKDYRNNVSKRGKNNNDLIFDVCLAVSPTRTDNFKEKELYKKYSGLLSLK